MPNHPTASLLATASLATRRALVAALVTLAAQGLAQAGVVAPPLSAALLKVCRGGPCLVTLPRAEPAAAGPVVQTRSSRRDTRRST